MNLHPILNTTLRVEQLGLITIDDPDPPLLAKIGPHCSHQCIVSKVYLTFQINSFPKLKLASQNRHKALLLVTADGKFTFTGNNHFFILLPRATDRNPCIPES